MLRQELLRLILEEPNLQQRLHLLVENGFKEEATELIVSALRRGTALFYFDWHDLSSPLSRWSKADDQTGTFVVIHSGSKLDRAHPSDEKHDWEICFEYGWEREALKWSDEQVQYLVLVILSQSVARPLNQWTFRQAQGNGEIVWRLPGFTKDHLAMEVAALYLIYQLRQADFGNLRQHLECVQGFDPKEFQYHQRTGYDDTKLIDWIIGKLRECGWTDRRIWKELVEWVWLKSGTWPQWLLGVAQAEVFDANDPVLATAVKHQLVGRIEYAVDTVPARQDKMEMCDTFVALCAIARWSELDADPVKERLVYDIVVKHRFSHVEWFVPHLGKAFGLGDSPKDALVQIAATAADRLKATKQYGRYVALAQRFEWHIDDEIKAAVETRGLDTTLG